MSDKLIDAFIAEAGELIVEIEKALLDVGKNGESDESISAIFRAMHTLKGAGGMFGFDSVSNLTHHLENIYQDIRDGKQKFNEDIAQVTFQALDLLRELLSGPSSSAPPAGYHEILQRIAVIAHEQPTEANTKTEKVVTEDTYYIKFVPKENIMRNGTNPLYLVDDLLALGHGFALPFFDQLPALADIQPDRCYMSFEVVLATNKPEDEIKSVFLFVEGNCEFEVKTIATENCIADYSFENHPFLNRSLHAPVGFEAIKKAFEKKHAKRVAELAVNTPKSKTGNIRVSADRLDELMNLVSELVTTQARLSLYSNINSSAELASISENIEKITRRLRDNTFTMTLVPLEALAVRFQRLVNDLSKELGKSIEFRSEGLDTRVDKSIIEKVTDPILHILRNCIDHGIESQEARERNGKKGKGSVILKSYYSGANVVIEIADDGAGLNPEKIRNKAISQGLIDADVQLSEKELVDLIFLPGFSTAATVTGVSGRGVGMDVVKRNIEEIRGEVQVNSTLGKGTTFMIRLPLTLSILDGLLVSIGNVSFILPLSAVAKCHEIPTKQLEESFNKWITLDGQRVPFVYLRDSFSVSEEKPLFSQVISVPYNGSTVGLAVDKIVGEYQAVLKPLGNLYKDQEEFSGASILGDGTVALVLDTNKVIRKLAAYEQAELA